MIKKIKPDNKIFNSYEFQKDKYKFFLILQNLESETLELYSDEENYILCRGDIKWPTWIWTKDNFDSSLLKEVEEAIDLYRLDVDTRFTCKKELYDLLKKDNYKFLGEYYKIGFVVAGTGKTDEDILMVYNKPKLIQYTPNDYEFVYQVKKEVYQKYVEECFGTWNEELQKNLYNQFIETEKDNLYIIQLNGKDIGFYNGKTLEDGSYEIGNICIIPEYQGKGIGTQILTDIIKLHKEQDLHLQYFKQNPVGKLYEKLGFVHDYEKKFHYVMVKLK